MLAGIGVYFFSKPYFNEITQNQLAQSNLERSIAKTSEDLNRGLGNMEALKATTQSKLEELRNEIRAIQTHRIEIVPDTRAK